MWALAGVLLLAVAVAVIRRHAAVHPSRIESIAVLPLMNMSGDAQQEYFSDGMTDELIG
jgi:TolB-like protein